MIDLLWLKVWRWMSKPLDEALSLELAERIKSKAKKTFDNAYRAALATPEATYVQGFLVALGYRREPVEHAWIETADCIIDPNLPHIKQPAAAIHYFPAQRLSVKKLKAAIEEAEEDYPEDDPLPIYGAMPYAYYGDVMLGGKDYQDAFEAAEAKCIELTQQRADLN